MGGGNAGERECDGECGGGCAEELGERLVVGREGGEGDDARRSEARKCAQRGWDCTRAVVQHEAVG